MKSVCGLCTCACMCAYVHVCEVTSSLALCLMCEQRSLSEPWAHQLTSLTGHPSLAIHSLCVLTIVVCVPPCLSFYLRTNNPNSGAHTSTVSTLPTISLPSNTKTTKQTLLLMDSVEGDTLHRSTAVGFFVASTTYLSQTLMKDCSSLTYFKGTHRTKCNSSCDPNQVVTL